MMITFMSLAYFYLVIGELIINHQKAIFNYDVFSTQPLGKPGDKSEKTSYYKLKDKKNKVAINFLTFISHIQEVITNDVSLPVCEIDEIYFTPFTSPEVILELHFRGPPTS